MDFWQLSRKFRIRLFPLICGFVTSNLLKLFCLFLTSSGAVEDFIGSMERKKKKRIRLFELSGKLSWTFRVAALRLLKSLVQI